MQVGALVWEDEGLKLSPCMDVARILIRTKKFSMINEELRIVINNEIFNILMLEDPNGVESRIQNSVQPERFRVSNDTSSEDSVNESGKEDEGSEYEYVPETALEERGGGGSESGRSLPLLEDG